MAVSSWICCAEVSAGEPAGVWEKFLRLRLQILKPLCVDGLAFAEKGCQRAVDEVDAVSLVRARRVVGGNDLGRHRIDVGGLLAGEEDESGPAAPIRLPAAHTPGLQNSRPVRGQPDRTQPRSGPDEERSS